MSREVFICHSSEDKAAVARPLAQSCEANGVSFWLDEAEIHWGDSVTGKVNKGLSESKFVVVVLSESFLKKHWPARELNAAMNLEASTGEVKVLPLLVGNEKAREAIIKEYQLLNDKRYLVWDGDPGEAVRALLARLGHVDSERQRDASTAPVATYQPKIKRRFTDRDRDKFLKDAYATVRQYFNNATNALTKQQVRIDAEVEEVSNAKFVCQVFVDGTLQLKCKIWRGSGLNDGAICYYAGTHMDVSRDNTFNEILAVDDDGHDLFFRGSLAVNFNPLEQKPNATAIADYLWRQFIQPLEQ